MDDFEECLKYEAHRTGRTVDAVRAEEEECRRLIAEDWVTLGELTELAATSDHPEYMLEAGESYPF